jgi:hypothetical protein
MKTCLRQLQINLPVDKNKMHLASTHIEWSDSTRFSDPILKVQYRLTNCWNQILYAFKKSINKKHKRPNSTIFTIFNIVGSPYLSEISSVPYRTATDRLSFKKIARHLNGFSVYAIWRGPQRTENAFYSFF